MKKEAEEVRNWAVKTGISGTPDAKHTGLCIGASAEVKAANLRGMRDSAAIPSQQAL